MPKPIPNTQTGSLTDHEHGTNDTLIGFDNAINTLYGDAFAMYDSAHGVNDTLIGGTNSTNTLYGDAYEMHDNTRGGNDTLIGGDDSTNNIGGVTATNILMVIKRHRGEFIKGTGDGTISTYASAADAMEAAIEIHHAVTAMNRGKRRDRRHVPRAGLAVGDVYDHGGDIYGRCVNWLRVLS